MDPIIEYKNIGKSYQDVWVVRDFNLSINEGDFLCIVGTSGSGKTTLLKMINGLIVPDEGDITIFGTRVIDQDIISLRRKIGYAIQGNGLFPHMTVANNIGYVPKLDGTPKETVDAIVDRMLSLVGLPLDSKGKYPKELSGGQQEDLKKIHKQTDCTIVFITHDMHEAFKLGTHILVMHEGKIQQYGTAEEVKNHPSNEYVKQLVEMTR